MGYVDRWSVAPGEPVRFMVSSEAPEFDAQVVHLRGGGPRPGRPSALVADELDWPANGRYAGFRQQTVLGSYGVVPHDDGVSEMPKLLVETWIYPTLVPCDHPQAVLGKWSREEAAGWCLLIDEEGRVGFEAFTAEGRKVRLAMEEPLLKAHWHRIVCSADEKGEVRLAQRLERRLGIDPVTGSRAGRFDEGLRLGSRADWLIAASGLEPIPEPQTAKRPLACFNGKIDNPTVEAATATERRIEAMLSRQADRCGGEGLTIVAWDFSIGMPTAEITDVSGNGRDGRLVNAPLRAVTGRRWTGEYMDHRFAPDHYSAIHFHDDDLEDACWQPSVETEVPSDAPSGVYALRVRAGEDEDMIPFFVRPPRGRATAPIAFVLPTFTYLTYANFLYDPEDAEWMSGGDPVYDPIDPYIWSHPELGFSMYNLHSDGSGIAHGSGLRPMLDLRPEHRFWLSGGGGWGFSSDMYLIDWLEANGYSYDIITDHDLHHEGAELLSRYRAVMTGSHPEYTSRRMLDAYATYSEQGGNIMYLGGNGFYWVTGVMPDRPHVLEIRRGQTGSRTWESAPGEVHLSSTGEPGSLWRHRGWAPQRVFGVGMDAQGGGGSAAYEATDAARDPRVSFIFEGVDLDELIGDFGNNGDGAAGDEIDRLDYGLGTPPHALLLATSSGRHSDFYMRVIEEVPIMLPGKGGTEDPDVRSDMTYFETPNGGAVFTTGSINWIASLSHNDYDNNVSRITANVLDRFSGGSNP